MERIIKIILAILFSVCLLELPYGYYQLVRFLGMVGFGILAYSSYSRGNSIHFIIWLSSAILINPIFKIALGREIWIVIDIIWTIGLIISLKTEKTSKNDLL